MRKHGLTVAFIAVLLAATSGTVWVVRHPLGGKATAKSSIVQAPPRRDTTAFDASMANILHSYPNLDIGVSVADLSDDATYNYGDQTDFDAASIGKLVTATMYLHLVEQGSASLASPMSGTSAGIALQRLIILSDNNAWISFNTFLTHDGLSAYAKSIGAESYNPADNTLDCNDVTLLLTKLYQKQLLNDAHTQLLLTYMQQANETNFIVAAVPPGATVYHKVGFLDDRLHEAAIVVQNGHAYAITIMSKTYTGIYDGSVGHTLFGQITQAADQTFLQ